MQVNIESIQVNSGRREALPDAVRELADSISAVGLLNPITVDRDYTLIAGLHRLEAAKLLGWAEIECNVSSLEGLQAELAEIDENFVRADLETLEFGKLLLRRKEIYEMLHPQVKNGGDRKSEKIRTRRARSDSDKSFVRDTADKLGISTRSVEEKIQIARDMTPRAQEIVQDAGRKIKKKDLVKLSRMEPKQQEQAAAQLAAGEIKSADEFRQEEPPKPSKPPEPAHEPERSAEPVTEPLALPTVPYSLGDRHYDTLEESIADLKNPDKDCSYTPDTLLADIDGFVQTFHKGFAWYHDPFCTVVFPHISKVQFEFVRQRFESISSAMPVMEGKCILFKEFGGVDAIPLCVRSKDVDEIVRTVQLLAGSFGGINLEDISSPRCFEIEEKLKAVCDIPVFHDDQHGTAVVVTAALINAVKLTGRKMEDLKVVQNGPGAAGTAIIKMLLGLGIKDIVAVDSKGIIYPERTAGMTEQKKALAEITNPRHLTGDLKAAVEGADVFVGTSIPGCLTKDMIRSMNKDPIIFACANPTPEIYPEEAMEAGAAVICTSRSDFPNQVNNVLVFPGLFRGALDARASQITENMKVAAARAIAGIMGEGELDAGHILPSIFDERVLPAVSAAVMEAAKKDGVSRL